MTRSSRIFLGALLLCGCARQLAPRVPKSTGSDPTAAHEIVLRVAACWLGPPWDEPQRSCERVVERVWGRLDQPRLEQLRAIDPAAVADVTATVRDLARSTPDLDDSAPLADLTHALADAAREAMWARRAADRIKRDLADDRTIAGDASAAMDPLGTAAALSRLHGLHAGRYSHDAHAMSLMITLDRLQLANGLPRALRITAAEAPLRLLFEVAPAGATAGAWLTYLVAAASAAGHPVPAEARLPKDRNVLAWAGVLDGITDDLERDRPLVSPPLRPLIAATIERLSRESADDRRAAAAAIAAGQDGRGTPRDDCPATVAGARTRMFRLKDGVAVEVSANDPHAVAAIRERKPAGDDGQCPIVSAGTTVTSENEPDGVRFTVRPTHDNNLTALFEATENRIDGLGLSR